MEPIYAVAYKRRYLRGDTWHYQYVIDPVAKRLIDAGYNEREIESAYEIPLDRRLSFQAYIQKYVDMSISSTINIPAWGSELNNESTLDAFGKLILHYIPQLRGITVFPDGCRGGQPLTPVRYSTASRQAGIEFVEGAVDVCDIRGGSCGS